MRTKKEVYKRLVELDDNEATSLMEHKKLFYGAWKAALNWVLEK